MKQELLTVTGNRPVTATVWEMILSGLRETLKPGQFVNLRLEGSSCAGRFRCMTVKGRT